MKKRKKSIKESLAKIKTFPQVMAYHPWFTLGALIILCVFLLLLFNFSCDSTGAKLENTEVKIEKKFSQNSD